MLSYWEITSAVASAAGADRFDFARKGQRLSLPDCLTAAVAREQAAILLTSNLRHVPMADVHALSLRATDIV